MVRFFDDDWNEVVEYRQLVDSSVNLEIMLSRWRNARCKSEGIDDGELADLGNIFSVSLEVIYE